jgi:hypothetical protein
MIESVGPAVSQDLLQVSQTNPDVTVELHIVWDGAPAEGARVDYFKGGTKEIDDLVTGLRASLISQRAGNLPYVNAEAMQMKVLHNVFPEDYWTTDVNQREGKDFDFAVNGKDLNKDWGGSILKVWEFATDKRLQTFHYVLVRILNFGMTLQTAGLHPKVWIFSDGQGPPYT